MANKKSKSKVDSPALRELELAARVKKLEQQQVKLLKEINAAVAKIMKACEKALTPQAIKKPTAKAAKLTKDVDKPKITPVLTWPARYEAVRTACQLYFDISANERQPITLERLVRDGLKGLSHGDVAATVLRTIKTKQLTELQHVEALIAAFNVFPMPKQSEFKNLAAAFAKKPTKHIKNQR